MALCIDATSGSDGFYQLSYAIIIGRLILLWHRFRLFWKASALRDLLCCGSNMGIRNYLEPYMATILPIWSARMGVAKPDLLEETAN